MAFGQDRLPQEQSRTRRNSQRWGLDFLLVTGGIAVDSQGRITLNLDSPSGLAQSTDGLAIDPKSGGHISIDADGVYVDDDFVLNTGDTMTGALGIGGAPDASSILGLTSTTLGFLPPVMTTAQRNAISSPAYGLVVVTSDAGVATTYRLNLFNSDDAWDSIPIGNTAVAATAPIVAPNAGGDVPSYSVSLQYDSDHLTVDGSDQLAINNLVANWTNGSILWGDGAGAAYTSAGNSIALGNSAGAALTTGPDNVMIGGNAGAALVGGQKNVLLGRNAGNSLTSGGYNICIGYRAGAGMTTTSSNIFIGGDSGYQATGANNVFIGTSSGADVTTGNNNVFMGGAAGRYCTTGSNNVAIGRNTLGSSSAAMTGDYNIAIGYLSGGKLQGGDRNMLIGYNTGYDLTSGYDNVAIGNQAGNNLTTSMWNMLIGSNAGAAMTTGARNVCIGFNSGNAITDGNDNILIGAETDAGASSAVGIAIGNYAIPKQDHSAVIGGNSGSGYIEDIWFGRGPESTAPRTNLTMHATDAVTTSNRQGTNLILAGGVGTGTGVGGSISFHTAPAGAAGATQNSLVDRARIDSDGNCQFGSTSNYVNISSGGHLTLVGDATVRRSVKKSFSDAKVLGASNVPDFDQITDDGSGSVGVYAYSFEDDDQLFGTLHMPNDWKAGSDIEVEVHWSPRSDVSPAEATRFGMEYTWVNEDATIGNTSSLESDVTVPENSNLDHLTDSIGTISGSGKTADSLLTFRFYREAASAGTNYTGEVFVYDIDIYYESDKLGEDTV